jgi:hypothetical protein
MNTLTETDPAAAIRAHLETIKRDKFQELRSYPQPIAGCDVQFNRLAEERDAVFRELERCDIVRRDGKPAAIDEFLRSSVYFDAGLKAEFSRLNHRSG